ncbi:MAG: GAF domain-containing protein [Anaerolineae bacterium]|nr:GAF domain-containing protein [Anaerolineae bacterium]
MIEIGHTKPATSGNAMHVAETDLTEELLRDAERRATRLQAAAEISRAATSQLNLEELLSESVELIRARFDLYYVGIFLLDGGGRPDREGQWAVLRAGTGEPGRQMLAAHHRLRLGGDSMIGQCVATGEARIALDVAEAGARFENPVLPKTQSEMALPLTSRNRVLGAMTIQSEEPAAFSDEDITVLQTMADQLANAIQNALLFEGMNQAVRENELLSNISARIGAAETVEDLVSASLDVAVFLKLDSVSLSVFTRWDESGQPLTAEVYEVTTRSDTAGTHPHSLPVHGFIRPVDRALYLWYAQRARRDAVRIVRIPDVRDTEGVPDAVGDAPDAAHDMPDAVRSEMLARGHRSVIVAPLTIRGRDRGILVLAGGGAWDDAPDAVGDVPDAVGDAPDAAGDAPDAVGGARERAPSEGKVQVFVRTLVDQVVAALDRQFLVAELSHRATNLQRASEVSRVTSSYLDQQQLLDEGAELILERFDLAFVGIFLVDDSGQWAVLQSSAGAVAGDEKHDALQVGYRLPITDASRIGRSISRRDVVTGPVAHGPAGAGTTAVHITATAVHTPATAVHTPASTVHTTASTVHAPDAAGAIADRAEAVFPLISQGRIIGAIMVQSDAVSGLSEGDLAIFSTLAAQLANAIANAQLYEMSQLNLQELQRLQQRYALEMWDDYVARQDILGYAYDLNEITPLTAAVDAHDGVGVTAVANAPDLVGASAGALSQTLEIRGEPVGMMSFEEPGTPMAWSEDQGGEDHRLSVLEAVREQLELALENRLLIDRSQRALREARQRESELGFLQEVSALLNTTSDVVASRGEFYRQLKSFLPLSQLTLTGYDSDSGRLTWLASEGDRATVHRGGGHHRYGDGASDLEGSGFDWAIANQSVVVEDDLRVDSRFSEDVRLVAAGVASRVILPLRLGYRTMGALELASDEPAAFTRPGLRPILQQVASQVASAMERGNLLRVAQSSAEESRRLYEVTSDLAEAADASDILDAIARHALPVGGGIHHRGGGRHHRTARAEIGLFVVDPETGMEQEWLEIVAVHDTASAVHDTASAVHAPDAAGGPLPSQQASSEMDSLHLGARLRISEVPALQLLGDQQMAISEDIASDPGLSPEVRASYLAQGVCALVVLSLSTGMGTYDRIGILQIRFASPYRVTEEDRRLYRTISEQAAVVLANRQLFQESQSRIMRQAVAVELANLTTSLSEREGLLETSVEFLRDRFDLYFAGIFLADDLRQWAVLQAGSGDVGERLMLMGHRVQVDGKTMVGRCLERRSRILSLDIDRATAVLENPLLPETRSAVVFPLVSRGQTNGAITLQSTQRFAFTQEDLGTLELMVNQLANVIESTNLYERSQASLAETRMLYRIAQQITDAREADAVLQAAVEGISQRAEPDWVIAGLLEPRQNPTSLRISASWSRDGVPFPRESLSLESIRHFYDVLRSDERFVTPNITQDPMVDDLIQRIYSDLGLRATAAFQLSVRSQQYGTIMVHSQTAREFSTAELSFYENVARQAFVALENISLVETTREQAERRDILNEVLQTASSSLEQSHILQDVSQVIARRLAMPVLVWEWHGISALPVAAHDAGGAVLATPDDQGGQHHCFQLQGPAMERIHSALLTHQPMDIAFGSQGKLVGLRTEPASDLVDGYAVPLVARDEVYGVMVLGRQMGHERIDEPEREFMRTAGANVAVALETATLYLDAQETAEKLKEVDELKNQFMANMSHELRTPLNSIIGFSRVMLKGIDGPLTEMQETDLGAIYESGRHLLNLINDILDISKINAGKMEVIFEPVDLKSMIQSSMSTAMGFVKDKPVRLLTDVPDDLPLVVADSRRIRQVLINLLGNAGKFTDEGFIKVSVSSDDYQVLVSVQDTGIGIPPDRIHAVFEQFEQVDSSSSRRYQGTGLGVPLSREFVRLHGGDMWIQKSIVGEGTTFCFSLPIGGPDSVQESLPLRDAAQGRIVLVVDDDEAVITLFRRYLERQGYKVFGLTRGDRVIEEAVRLRPYAITLDVLMPGRDGWTVIQELKSNPETRDIPIIICSILGEQDRGISMGVTGYLIKPISEQALLETLARLGEEGGHVLVVDDNPDDRKLLRRILESAGYDVWEAAGGAEAIERINDSAPSLVVLDLMMPEVDGFAVLEQLKRDHATRSIPVVVVTARELTRDERARLQQQVESLLQKGLFDQEQLLSDVAAALSRLRRDEYAFAA